MKKATVVAILLFAAVQLCVSKPKTAKPSAASPKSVVEAYIAAWDTHNPDAIDKFVTADTVHEDIADGTHAHGPAEIKAFLKDEVAAMPDFDWHPTNVVESGNTVTVEWTWTATYTGPDPSGAQVRNLHVTGRGASVAEVEHGHIKRITDYYDNASFFPKPAEAK